MKEISLNILDIAENSVRAGATLINITLNETAEWLSLEIRDNGHGMSEEYLAAIRDPFTTSRTTRKVGLGIPLLTLAAEQTGGEVRIESSVGDDHGTTVYATFCLTHIDCMPLGNMVDTLSVLIQGSPDIDFVFSHCKADHEVALSTREIRDVLGPSVSLDDPEVILWIRESLKEEYRLL